MMIDKPRYATVLLDDRALVQVGGQDAAHLLHNLVTCDVENLGPGEATFGALLTPQGKILFDFFIQRVDVGFLFDVAAEKRADFVKRLMFYKLRADMTISASEGAVHVSGEPLGDGSFRDPRLAELGWRSISHEKATSNDRSAYDAHRIALGMPEGGRDFSFGEAFPHEVLMDQFGNAEGKAAGVAFTKGCYVGQEVVSRMQHRGTARNRIIKASGNGLEAGMVLEAGGKPCGTIGSVSGSEALAMVRLDRAKRAMDAGHAIHAGDGQRIVPVNLALPDFVRFGWPDNDTAENDA